jgi:hypothetical protein
VTNQFGEKVIGMKSLVLPMRQNGLLFALSISLLGVVAFQTTSKGESRLSLPAGLGPIMAAAARDDDDSPTQSPTPNLKPGSPDEAVYNFCMAIVDDNTATASDFISSTAKGIAGQIRDGEYAEEKIDDLISFMTPFNELRPTPDQGSSTKRGLRNARSWTMSFGLKKEKDVYKITELSITKSKR